jgi:hypothetical protein
MVKLAGKVSVPWALLMLTALSCMGCGVTSKTMLELVGSAFQSGGVSLSWE